jgi:hypothetical protein
VGADAPVALVAADVSGSTVTFTWVPPQVGLVPDGYLLEGGVAPGQVLAALPTPDAVPRLTVTAPPGVYFVRVRAIAVGRAGNASNEVRVAIGIPTPPSSPAGLLGLANGADLALSWTNTFDGGVPTRLQLIVVDGPVTGIVPLPLTESFRFSGVPDGTYTFRVVAANASGASPPSAPVTLTFPGACIGPPGAVTHVTLQRQGTVVTVSWLPPPLGPAVETYIVFVSGAATGSLSTAARSVSGVVGRGTHTVHVAAANACGTGPRSTPHTVVVP